MVALYSRRGDNAANRMYLAMGFVIVGGNKLSHKMQLTLRETTEPAAASEPELQAVPQ